MLQLVPGSTLQSYLISACSGTSAHNHVSQCIEHVSQCTEACTSSSCAGSQLFAPHAHICLGFFSFINPVSCCRYLLPPIIFYAGISVKKKQFFRNFASIAIFGVLGTYIAFAVIACVLYGFSKLPNVLNFSVSCTAIIGRCYLQSITSVMLHSGKECREFRFHWLFPSVVCCGFCKRCLYKRCKNGDASCLYAKSPACKDRQSWSVGLSVTSFWQTLHLPLIGPTAEQ